MSLQTTCAQFRAIGTLPISGFVSEDMLGLEASNRVHWRDKPFREYLKIHLN